MVGNIGRGWAAASLVMLTTAALWAQPPAKGERRPTSMPSDPKLLDAFVTFVKGVEKLGADYEKAGQPDKARECYEQILRVAPEYAQARKKIAQLTEQEYTADLKAVEVTANKDWQDAGIVVVPGKPLRIEAKGSWTVSVTQKVGPGGLEASKHQNAPLGALVGAIGVSMKDAGEKPFVIGEKKDLTPDRPGRLWLRISGDSVAANSGKLTVQVSGTFERK